MEAYNAHGDHIVHIRIKLPVKLTEEQKEIFEDYARLPKVSTQKVLRQTPTNLQILYTRPCQCTNVSGDWCRHAPRANPILRMRPQVGMT